MHSEREDRKLPATAAALGILVIITCLGLRPTTSLLPCLAISFAAGFFLLPGASFQLPLVNYALIPNVSAAAASKKRFGKSRIRKPTTA